MMGNYHVRFGGGRGEKRVKLLAPRLSYRSVTTVLLCEEY
jgi:hypothetical protein